MALIPLVHHSNCLYNPINNKEKKREKEEEEVKRVLDNTHKRNRR
jgi:hypothetical protein